MKKKSKASHRLWARKWVPSLALIVLSLVAALSEVSRAAGTSQPTTSIQINTTTIERGQVGSVTVDLTAVGGANGENTLGFSVLFDPTQLAFVSAIAGTSGASVTPNAAHTASGMLGIAVAKNPGTTFDPGTSQIAVISFKALGNGTLTFLPLTIIDSPIPREVVNVTAQLMQANWLNGSVTISDASSFAIFRSGFFWLLDVNRDQQFNDPPDRAFAFGGVPGDIPISGDWNGDGTDTVGVYRPSNGLFILDYDGDTLLTAADKVYNLGVGTPPGDIPVVGDWNGDGKTKVGLFRQGFFWILDDNGNGVFEQGVDKTYAFGGNPGDVPVVGDWAGTGQSEIGLVRLGFFWILDANGNGSFDGTGAGQDFAFAFGGIAGDVPVVGDWNGSGTDKVGMFRSGFFWVLDANGNRQFDGTGPGQDLAFAFGGISGDRPVVGHW